MVALTAEKLRELLSYDPDTGLFTWRKRTSNRVTAGSVAGHPCRRDGRLMIGIGGKVYLAHRLAWLHVHGTMPKEIDHVDGDPTNNRLNNLRECSHAQNQKNLKRAKHNTSGFKGVHYHRGAGKWRARIQSDGKTKSLGLHQTPEAAHAAYCGAALELHGDFARFQ